MQNLNNIRWEIEFVLKGPIGIGTIFCNSFALSTNRYNK